MAGPQFRSLEIVAEEVKGERQMQLAHLDSLDSKAGVSLGFAGAIVALAPTGGGLLVDLGRMIAVASGLLAVWSFWPRRYWHVDLRAVRDLLLPAEPVFARLRILDTQIGMADSMQEVLRRKARRLEASMASWID